MTRKTAERHTLKELLAATPADAWNMPEIIAWDRMPAVGREWPNDGWDKPLGNDEPVKGDNT